MLRLSDCIKHVLYIRDSFGESSSKSHNNSQQQIAFMLVPNDKWFAKIQLSPQSTWLALKINWIWWKHSRLQQVECKHLKVIIDPATVLFLNLPPWASGQIKSKKNDHEQTDSSVSGVLVPTHPTWYDPLPVLGPVWPRPDLMIRISQEEKAGLLDAVLAQC